MTLIYPEWELPMILILRYMSMFKESPVEELVS